MSHWNNFQQLAVAINFYEPDALGVVLRSLLLGVQFALKASYLCFVLFHSHQRPLGRAEWRRTRVTSITGIISHVAAFTRVLAQRRAPFLVVPCQLYLLAAVVRW